MLDILDILQASKMLQLQSSLDEKVLELKQQDDLYTAQTERSNKLSTQTETYIQRLREQKDLQAQSDEQYRGELQAQEKLTELYKVLTLHIFNLGGMI